MFTPSKSGRSSADDDDPDRTIPAADVLLDDDRFEEGTRTCAGCESAEQPTVATCELPETGGRYRIEREIARGAMGAVYKGRDSAFGREVAIKMLLPEHLGKRELRRRFAEEARITAHLQHSGIPPVYEAGEFPGGRPFYSMRLMDGRTLASLLASRSDARDDRSRYLKVFEEVCAAIAYAHEVGVIHRDLKPANVMVGTFGRVKVMDWGVAKALPQSRLFEDPPSERLALVDRPNDQAQNDSATALTQYGWILGTPAYMSPEQAQGHIDLLDERTDVFGLGGILCSILTGKSPYFGGQTSSVIRRAKEADLSGAHTRLDGCAGYPELVALTKRCLSADPVARPRDAGRLYAELTEYLDYDLRRAERDLVSFFELSLDLFCIAGPDGYFRRLNSNFTRVLGHSTEQLLSRPFIEFVHPDDRERTLEVVDKLYAGQSCVHFLNRYRDVHGEYRWFDWTAKGIPGGGMIFAVARDVTDQIRLEEQLRTLEGR